MIARIDFEVLALLCCLAVGCDSPPPRTARVVDISTLDIRSVHARLLANRYLPQADSVEVVIPTKHHALIKALLRGPVLEQHYSPKATQEVCRLRIVDDEDHEIQVMIWYDSKQPMLFSFDGRTPLTRSGHYVPVGGVYIAESAAFCVLVKAVIDSDEERQKQIHEKLWNFAGAGH